MRRRHAMPFGAAPTPTGGTRFRLWAPGAQQVDVLFGSGHERAMKPIGNGFFEVLVRGAQAGTRYLFRIDARLEVADPASRFNPDDVHLPSEVVDPDAFEWTDDLWRGRPWEEAVIYELHVGTFTAAGTFAAAIERLDYLADLGVTALEIMPVADFPGTRNWGYDGVLLFAPDAAYGTPDDLKRLIGAAHARGLMVLIDVVYNHFGPEGNYLHAYAPQFFNPRHQTPWGAAINYDGEHARTVRDFVIHNALYWIEEFHADGLRLDAVHAIADDSHPHLLTELARTVRNGPGRERHVHLVFENDLNQARHLVRDGAGAPLFASGQWNDDVHHPLHVLVTGETDGYYGDYAAAPVEMLGRALAHGFAYQGEYSAHRDAPRGEPSAGLPATAFVNFLQTHDQVGNRALGERLAAVADPAALEAAVACLLLAPPIPLLFMGEEFAASSPFLYFCDFGPALAEAVSKGRREEFARFAKFADPTMRDRIPDPNRAQTFERSKLDWDECLRPHHRRWLDLYRHLLALRRKHVVPRLALIEPGGAWEVDGGEAGRVLRVSWRFRDRTRLTLVGNFGDAESGEVAIPRGERIYATAKVTPGERQPLPPWAAVFVLESARG